MSLQTCKCIAYAQNHKPSVESIQVKSSLLQRCRRVTKRQNNDKQEMRTKTSINKNNITVQFRTAK